MTEVIRYMNDRGLTRAEASLEAQNGWNEYVLDQGKNLLRNEVDSWQTGININLEGRQTRMTVMCAGGQPSFRRRCEEVVQNGYKELNLK